MKREKTTPPKSLRQRAEKILRGRKTVVTQKALPPAEPELYRLLHELQVYQVGLEVQNEKLRRALDEVADLTEQFQALLSAGLFGFWLADTRGIIREVNDTYCQMSGYGRDELLNTPIAKVEAIESAKEIVQHAEQVMAHRIERFETRHRAKNGLLFDVEINTVFIPSQERFIVFIFDISNRLKTEKDLQLSESLYHAIVEDQTDLICRYQPDGRITFANQAYLRVFNKRKSEVIGQNYIPRIPEPDLSTILEQLKGITIHTQCASVEHRVIMDDGTVCWQHWGHRGIFSSAGILLGYQAVGRDITERKLAELGRQLLERRAQTLLQLNSMHECTETEIINFTVEACQVVVESQFAYIGLIDATESIMTMRGCSKNVLTHCAVEPSCNLPIDKLCLRDKMFLTRRPVMVNEYDTPHADKHGYPAGHIPIKRFLQVPIFDGSRIVAVIAVANKFEPYDNDDVIFLRIMLEKMFGMLLRKRHDEALIEEKNRLQSIMDHIPDLVWLKDPEGRYVAVNIAVLRFFGKNSSEILGKTDQELWPKELAEKIRNDDHSVMESGASKRFEEQIIDKDGAIIWTETVKTPTYNLSGRLTGITGFAHNINFRKEAESALLQAKTAAEAASKSKSVFLATMSHEIRTPMNALLGNLELLSEAQLTPQELSCLDNSKVAAEMLLQTINGVLDFSKIDAGKLELVYEPFSVSSLAQRLVQVFSTTAERKGLRLTCVLADNLPVAIFCDQHRLRQILANLLSNAIKFTEQGTVCLEITREQIFSGSDPDRAVLALSVRDTGKGILPADQERVFDSFTQVEDFGTRRHGGTGLGLAICKRLAGMMGGTLFLSSTVGEGSVFTLFLPVDVKQTPAQETRSQRSKKQASTPRNILLADDEEMGRTVMSALLQRRGHTVTAVEDGATLLAVLQQQQFDIVISDISMPDMDGVEVVRTIRSGELPGIDPLIPVVAMTAHAFIQDKSRFLINGFSAYASKPVDLDELLHSIDELCSKGP